MKRKRVGLVVEQALGHVAYGQSVKKALEKRDDIELTWIPVPFEPQGISRLPGLRSNWSIRGSLNARRAIARALKSGRLDALFLHTQTIALLAAGYQQRIPTLLSLDATPANLDTIAHAYNHKVGPRAIEALKRSITRRVISRARWYTTWSEWTKVSLVSDYGAPADKITVIHPGTNLANFPPRNQSLNNGRLRVLFVGGDFERKGGDLLIKALHSDTSNSFELHAVTAHDLPESDRLRVYHGIKPHSPELLRLYREADIFALPTRGDCLAVVLGEALAAGLPVITTPVGAHAEIVKHHKNGWIIPVDDDAALLESIREAAGNAPLLSQMSVLARATAEERFDIDRGANAIGDILVKLASGDPATSLNGITDREGLQQQ